MAHTFTAELKADSDSLRAQFERSKEARRTPRPEQRRRSRKPTDGRSVGEGYDTLPTMEGWAATPDGKGFRWVAVDYARLAMVAMRFAFKAKTGEKDDLLHSIIEGLARVARRKAAIGEDFSEAAMHRTAEHIKDGYWHSHYAYTTGLYCRNCSREQKAKCRYNWAHTAWAYTDCHRAIHLESLNQPITDSEGNITELGDLIIDDNALDLVDWVDSRTWLIGAPIRLKAIAMKKSKGEALTHGELCYLSRLRTKHQKRLV